MSINKINNYFQRFRTSFLPNLENWLGRKFLGREFGTLLVYSLVIVYTIIFSYFTILKFYSFSAFAWDLGIFNQSFWTTINSGNLFVSNVQLFVDPTGNFFAIHFSPILFFVLPFYYLFPSVEGLLILQSFILGLGALPLYYYTKNILKQKTIAIVISISYLMYPALQGINWFDFHAQAFLPVLFFSVMYFFSKEKWVFYFSFTILSLLVAENVPLIIIFIGLYCFWFYRTQIFKAIKTRRVTDKRIFVPFLTIAIALSWMIFALWVQQTYFPIDPEYSQLYNAVDNWSILGIQDSPISLPLYVLFNPGNAITALSFGLYEKMLYMILLFAPLLFLSLSKRSITAITLVWFFPTLLSNYRPYYLLGTHFPAYIIAFLFVAAVHGIKKSSVRPHYPNLNMYAKYIMLASLIFAIFASPLSPLLSAYSENNTFFSDYRPPAFNEHTRLLQRVVDIVPNDASILTQNNIFTHFSGRANSYVYPLPSIIENAPSEAINDYINNLFEKVEFVLIDANTDFFTSNALNQKIDDLGGYGIYAAADGICLFKKNYSGEPIFYES